MAGSLPIYEPMLATRWREPFVDDDWAFEMKWDGIRALLSWDGATSTLRSRTGNDVTATYPELAGLTSGQPVILDGEVVAFGESGLPSFGRLQQRMNVTGEARVRDLMSEVPVAYVAFDVLFAGAQLIDEPWHARRETLEGIDLASPGVVSEVVMGDPEPLWSFISERDIEGIVAKRVASVYRPGTRSPDWRKITRFLQARAVVGGFLPGEGGRTSTFGSLLLGMWADDGLRWVGAVGSGFDDAALEAIRHALDQMTMERSPFVPNPDLPKNAVFVHPALVALVQYKEFTSVGRLRAPSFKGFTDDDPGSVTWEEEGPEGGG
jgi:bifunctional non-homologous end joining protein LigD